MSRRSVLVAGAAAVAGASAVHAQEGAGFIAVNQVGWRPGWPKVALLVDAPPRATVDVVEAGSGQVAAVAPTRPPRTDPQTGMRVQAVDVSGLTRPGRYVLAADGLRSPSFAVDRNVCRALLAATLRSFRLQGCGRPLDDPVTGLHHRACHAHDAIVANGPVERQIDATGGWHDAGDYGKYVATTAVATGRLLGLYELTPGRFHAGELHLPGHRDGLPDILAEAATGLDWMMRMQRADGAVYRKVGGRQWPGTVMPEDDTQPRYAYGISTPETAKAAAAWAIAARVLKSVRPQAAARYLAAAMTAWHFLETTPQMVVEEGPDDDAGSGRYLFGPLDREEALRRDDDDRLWAAAELAITTGRKSFAAAFEQLAADAPVTPGHWKDVSSLGIVDWLLVGAQARQRPLHAALSERLAARADEALGRYAASPWGRAHDRYEWGSNNMVAAEGLLMLAARRLSGRGELLAGAVAQLDWLLGRNPLGRSFVTGFGVRAPRHVHHRLMQATGIEVPGMMVGGPNDGAPDGVAPRGRGVFSYADDVGSYATNEPAIDYNATFAVLVALLDLEGGP